MTPRPALMKAIDYREILRTMLREANGTPSIGSIRRLIKSIFGVDPNFYFIRDILGTYVDDPANAVDPFWVDDATSVPPVVPETVWDKANLAYGVVIHINDPLACGITREFVERAVYKFTPSWAPTYITGV